MDEACCYNAIAVALEGDYGKIKNLKRKHENWCSAWHALKAKIDPRKEWDKLAAAGARLLLKEDFDYPELLKEIPGSPFGIYSIGGTINFVGKAVAIVGTRKATPEGRATAKNFSRVIAASGFGVVSGLALGIDAAAHAGCLEANGKTIAVLACGLDSIYPKTNDPLAKRIIESGGAIISEYPLGATPLPYRFLERNRIISGLAAGVLVIEAPEGSGSLATARFAMEQNRDVFVVPGPVSYPNYKGSNQLIRSGATLVTKPEEILEEYGILPAEERVVFQADSEEEKIIWKALFEFGKPVSVDKLKELTNLNTPVINRTVTTMILRNILEEVRGGYMIKKTNEPFKVRIL